ncbi:MAG: O-antigen ligase family protein [Deltaproteobacteria bacterium]|nr:O-antigen ligase family protein [Deltaproteobacteria bacterium]
MNNTRAIQIVLCIAIALPSIMLGGVHPQTLGIMLALATVLFAFLEKQPRTTLDFVGWTFLGLIALTAFQLIPLPAPLVQILSPASFELRQASLEAVGAPEHHFMPLAVDIPITLNELAKLFVYLSVYWSIKTVGQVSGTRFVLRTIAVLGFGCAVIFLGHKIVMARQVYGFYHPMHKMFQNMEVSAPLINPNHMAALLSICAFVSIGLALNFEEKSRRALFVTFSVFTGGALMLTLSRGGIAAFVAGQLAFITLMILRNTMLRKFGAKREFSSIAWLPVALAFSLMLGMLAAGDAIVGEYLDGDATKLGIWKEAGPLYGMYPWVGCGRGGFMMVFPQVSNWTSHITFTHAENVVVQLLVDYGLIFGPLVLLAFTIAVSKRILGIPVRSTTMAMTAALIAIGVHNMVDFNLEIPGVAVVAIAVLAVLTVSNPRAARGHRNWIVPFPGFGQYILAATSLLLCVAMLITLPNKQIETEENRAEIALARKDTHYFEAENFGAAIYRHPAAYYLFLLAGNYWDETGKQSPLPLWSRAMVLNPHAGAPHYQVGKFLLERGYVDQALLEFGFAAQNDDRYIGSIASRIAQKKIDVNKLLTWSMDDAIKGRMWDQLAGVYARQGRLTETVQIDNAVIALSQPPPGALQREARRLKTINTEKALQLAEVLGRLEQYRRQSILLQAEIWTANGELDKAIAYLLAHKGIPDPDNSMLRRLAQLYLQKGLGDQALETARQIRSKARSSANRVRAICFEGDLKKQLNNLHGALSSYKQALAIAPTDVEVMKKILSIVRTLKNERLEIEILLRLQRAEPNEAKWRDALEKNQSDALEKYQNRLNTPEI